MTERHRTAPPRLTTPCVIHPHKPSTCGYVYVSKQVRGVRKHWRAHRLAWEKVHGPIPAGGAIDHLCENKCCVNVEHLELVTNAENTRRWHAKQTHCIHGHPSTEANTYTRPHGRRECRACHREATRRRRSARSNH